MKLSGTERETIVLYNEAETAASIYTHNTSLCRQLSELCGTYPEQVRQTGDNGYGGLSFEMPKKRGRITPPRVLTPAQRAVLDKMNEKRHGG
ncbi:hypothetical protein DBN74_16735 [Enterococcus faecalis]|nr:hypothetical protein [Enterococcus faecalis]